MEAFTADKISLTFLFQGGDEIRGTRLARETEIAHMTELLDPGSISLAVKIDNLAGLDTKLWQYTT